MVYFYGKLSSQLGQVKIDPNNKGKIIQLELRRVIGFMVDFGFEGYQPLNVYDMSFGRYSKDETSRTVNIENLYDNLEVELVKDEFLYIYYNKIRNSSIEVKYENDNINYNNTNGYTFHVISHKDQQKTLFINNNYENFRYFNYRISFCDSSANTKHKNVEMKYKFIGSTTEMSQSIDVNKANILNTLNLRRNSMEISFKSEEDFIFSYSYEDATDQIFNNNREWKNQRQQFSDLKINNVKDISDKKDIISIEFYPNFKYSSTKYIIIIAPI